MALTSQILVFWLARFPVPNWETCWTTTSRVCINMHSKYESKHNSMLQWLMNIIILRVIISECLRWVGLKIALCIQLCLHLDYEFKPHPIQTLGDMILQKSDVLLLQTDIMFAIHRRSSEESGELSPKRTAAENVSIKISQSHFSASESLLVTVLHFSLLVCVATSTTWAYRAFTITETKCRCFKEILQ